MLLFIGDFLLLSMVGNPEGWWQWGNPSTNIEVRCLQLSWLATGLGFMGDLTIVNGVKLNQQP